MTRCCEAVKEVLHSLMELSLGQIKAIVCEIWFSCHMDCPGTQGRGGYGGWVSAMAEWADAILYGALCVRSTARLYEECM
ncbi:hypothetical protein XELAEV_18040946mg [Xenopus laevis]|uniref:Uncharacterized protein n=1 Tax=Xenopus laevis TaxID=8355 RepID=A0A974H9D6_XENLA|nr:hypothetical protein XELAEV_18040946mg [Xenopus laevis]